MRKLSILPVLLTGFFSIVIPRSAHADDPAARRARRLELSLAYEALSPRETYHSWKHFLAGYTSGPETGFTFFFQLGGFSRPEGEALLGVAGAYKDWSAGLYTYTALAVGSRSQYLPSFRLDHDVNIKLGKKRDVVWTLGAAFINYFNGHRDFILSTGLTAYLEGWILTYRIFGNRSDPGRVLSSSHLLDLACGREGASWTNLSLSFGKQAYLATYLARPEELRRGSLNLCLKHRRWIGKKGFGFLGEAGYFKLNEGYEKVGLSLGFFKEF